MKKVRNWSRKLGLYLQAAYQTRSINWRGLPILPKRLSNRLPHNRAAYNEFLLWIRRLLQLREANVVFDVGANHGVFSEAASTCFPNATVFLFEPLPSLRHVLESKTARAARWRFYPIGLGAVEGSLPLHVAPENDAIGSFAGFSKPYTELAGVQNVATINVPVDTLDHFCKREGVEHIDLLKIDVEGFEFAVLEGGRETLAGTTAIVIETSLIRATGRAAPLGEMITLLTRCGFYIMSLLPSFAPGINRESRPYEYNIIARRFDS